ncbi:hypothetical protein PILCRDRAFT_825280 [Piloderma croceum F 1598]|uniref:Uncharacterized protein n=1 Tax=Piloderma croceum (strain F 1598) TaxID=765440 RepID=A0A0C3BJG0_PILCF|nr:hypothetical protein PILCRDRAFT_825280 [Piloderma croceum F 1598]
MGHLLAPRKSAEEMSRMSYLISGTEEMPISSWRSQVTRGELRVGRNDTASSHRCEPGSSGSSDHD